MAAVPGSIYTWRQSLSYRVSRNHPFWPTVPLTFSLNVPKWFSLAAEEPCRWAALRKAATNWTLTTATSVRHARSEVIAPVQRRTNQPDGPMPHLEAIHWLKREQGEGGDSLGRGQWLTSCPCASCSAHSACVCLCSLQFLLDALFGASQILSGAIKYTK